MDLTDFSWCSPLFLQTEAEEPWAAVAVAFPAKMYKSVRLAVAYIFPRLLTLLYSLPEVVVHPNSKGCSAFKEQIVN